MDAEKNVIDAARKLTDAVYAEHFGSSYKRVRVDCLLVNELQAALSAYDAARKDSAPAPSEDRVREAAGAVHRAEMKWSNDNDDMRSFDEVRREALRPYVTPAPALPAGTVAVPVYDIMCLRNAVSSFGVGVPDWARAAREAADAITKRIPPPRPEPPKELVAEWARKARAAAADLYISTKGQSADGFRSGYVARCRAEWAKKGGG